MAMSVRYSTVNGTLAYENRGGVETEFVPDPLGSVIACRNALGTTTYTAKYGPYGEVRTETGTNASPRPKPKQGKKDIMSKRKDLGGLVARPPVERVEHS